MENKEKILEAVGALLLEKMKFIVDNIGPEKWQEFSKDEQRWLTYAAYQWGQGNVVKMLNDGTLLVKGKRIPLTNFVRYRDGKPDGRVQNVRDFVYRNNGRPRNNLDEHFFLDLKDFHSMASIVTSSSKVADAFFREYSSTNTGNN